MTAWESAGRCAPGGFAPAKVNLSLHVLGRRADGYHDLESLIAFAGVGDALTIADAEADRLEVEGPFAAAIGRSASARDNLTMRALAAFREAFGGGPRLIRLDKRLPVAAGIGGGSADAAAVLRLLAAELQVPLDEARLLEIARGLGADVPVCLLGRPCLVAGTGDLITPLRSFPQVAIVLANAGTAVATATVFRRWSEAPEAAPASLDRHTLEAAADGAALARALTGSSNMLTPAAVALAPEIGRVLDRLDAAEGRLMAGMSGSGGTCFALFADTDAADQAAHRIAVDSPGWWVASTRLVGW